MHLKFSNTIKYLLIFILFNPVLLTEARTFPVKPKHNFYLSISEIIYKPGLQVFEISIRFFSDDFEKTILNYDNTRIFDQEGNALQSANAAIEAYLKEHFILFDDKGKKIDYFLIGWETEKEVSWCYLEAKHKKFKYLKVKNNLLTEMFISQKNLVYLKSGEKETSVLLDRKTISETLQFD